MAALWADDKPSELVVKANIAIAAALEQNPLSRDDALKDAALLKCTSVSKLRNRGVLLNFASKEAALWVRKNGSAFAAAFDASVIVRDRGYQVLIKNVPVETDISNPDTLRAIERENDLPTDSFLRANWIRPIMRRREGQQNAHLRVAVSSAELANALI
ncbi:hypothetical protein EXIGLDRAFT_626687, partial [Exidia glandulosa HHB12029]